MTKMEVNHTVSCSIVCYENERSVLIKAINSFLDSNVVFKLYLIDNSPTNSLQDIICSDKVWYFHNPSNPGFGIAHNIAIKKAIEAGSKYHLILNPDIYFDSSILDEIINYMAGHEDVGILMPKILYPTGHLQPVAKLLPSPFHYLIRRFVPVKSIVQLINKNYELHNYKYDKPLEVPFISGCFMMVRTDVLRKIGGFDENIFMYTEDNDLCRRVQLSNFKTIVYPYVSVYHDHKNKSFLHFKTAKVFLASGFYYFNKWGWFFDNHRKSTNKRTLNLLKQNSKALSDA